MYWTNFSPNVILVIETHYYEDHQGTPEYATFAFLMALSSQPPPDPKPELLYCPLCTEEVSDPLTCGDCSAVICRRCGSPLESSDELGIG
jgi:hypothetical protein